MGKPQPDLPTGGQPYEWTSNHFGHISYEFGEKAANCQPGGSDFYGGDQSPDDDSDY